MNKEIKEILDDLLFTTTLPNVSIKLNKEKLNQLKNYITNLQKENKKLTMYVKEDVENIIKLKDQLKQTEELAMEYKTRIDKGIEELFELKDLIYKPETREINFDVQNKISTIIKTLGSDKE